MKTGYCQYNKCKAVSEFETSLGNYCPYHYKVMKKKKGLLGKQIKITRSEKEALIKSRLNPMITIKLKRR